MLTLKKVVIDDLYETIHGYVTDKQIIVEDYEVMVNTIIRMIKDGYCFTMDRDILRDAMECLTYMYTPSDDMNKDRLVQQFVDESDDSDDESSDGDGGGDGDFGNMDLMKMMQMMGAPTGNLMGESGQDESGQDESGQDKSCPDGECQEGGCEDGECKKIKTEEVPETPTETTVVKEEELIPGETVAETETTAESGENVD